MQHFHEYVDICNITRRQAIGIYFMKVLFRSILTEQTFLTSTQTKAVVTLWRFIHDALDAPLSAETQKPWNAGSLWKMISCVLFLVNWLDTDTDAYH